MVKLKRSYIRVVDEIFDMKLGYVLDFSNQTLDEFRIDIYDAKYEPNGTSFQGEQDPLCAS